jgi:hypothetical protein
MLITASTKTTEGIDSIAITTATTHLPKFELKLFSLTRRTDVKARACNHCNGGKNSFNHLKALSNAPAIEAVVKMVRERKKWLVGAIRRAMGLGDSLERRRISSRLRWRLQLSSSSSLNRKDKRRIYAQLGKSSYTAYEGRLDGGNNLSF